MHDDFAVSIVKEGVVVGSVVCFSRVVCFFLNRAGSIVFCEVTASQVNRRVGLRLEVP